MQRVINTCTKGSNSALFSSTGAAQWPFPPPDPFTSRLFKGQCLMLLSLVATHNPAWSGVITILNTGLVSRQTSVCFSVARRSVRYTAASLPLLTT